MKKSASCALALVASLVFAAPSIAAWKPAGDKMVTSWGEKLNLKSVWPEYPRPLLERPTWTNLNGMWSYAVTPKNAAQPTTWTGEILVPFALEAPLSGVGRKLEPNEALWYRRDLPAPAPGLRTRLNFEAVDYESIDVLCELRGNGVAAGVYTQTTDVEGELNGLLTYDRLPKASAAWFRKLSDQLLATPDVPAK